MSPFMKNKHKYLIIVFLIIATLAAFGRIAANEFIFTSDDKIYLTENSDIKSGLNPQSIQWAFTAIVSGNWHPLTMISHIMDWSLFGANPAGHHLVNLILHIGAVVLLFLFLVKTTNNIWPAAFAAALFALHPLRVESVAYAAERKDVLSMFFAMACLYVYAFYVKSLRFSQYFQCLILFVIALLAKPMVVTLPFLMLLLDYWPLKRCQKAQANKDSRSTGKLILEKIPFLLPSIAASIVAIWAHYKGDTIVPLAYLLLMKRVANAVVSCAAYLGNTLWPAKLALFYPYDLFLPPWKVSISVVVLALITFAVIYYIKKTPFLFVGWVWYLISLIPVLGFIQQGELARADRYTYLPSIGIAVSLAWGMPLLFKNRIMRKMILFPAGIAILTVFSLLTRQQCGFWKNDVSLWSHALKVTKDNYFAHNNIGIALQTGGNIKDALYHYNEAIRINPFSVKAYNNRGNLYAGIGIYNKALDDFNKSVRLYSFYANTFNGRGTVYAKLGQYQQALFDFSHSIRLQPDHAYAYHNRGINYARLNQYHLAIDDFNKAISLKKDDADFYFCRGAVYLNNGNKNSACRDAQIACQLGSCTLLNSLKREGYCR